MPWPWQPDPRIDKILMYVKAIYAKEIATMKELDDLTVQVKANTDAEASAVVLLGKLHDLIVAAGTDPVKLKELSDSLAASKDALAKAIVDNTPAGP